MVNGHQFDRAAFSTDLAGYFLYSTLFNPWRRGVWNVSQLGYLQKYNPQRGEALLSRMTNDFVLSHRENEALHLVWSLSRYKAFLIGRYCLKRINVRQEGNVKYIIKAMPSCRTPGAHDPEPCAVAKPNIGHIALWITLCAPELTLAQ